MAKVPPESKPGQTKYSSFAAFRRGVRSVRGVTQGERAYLNVLAENADFRTGLSHPGEERLRREAGLSDTGAVYVRKQLLAKRLIELLERGARNVGGRNHANLFRICVEDDRFPSEKTPKLDLGVSRRDTETPNPQVERPKPPSRPGKTPKLDLGPSNTTKINTPSKDGKSTKQEIPENENQKLTPFVVGQHRYFCRKLGADPKWQRKGISPERFQQIAANVLADVYAAGGEINSALQLDHAIDQHLGRLLSDIIDDKQVRGFWDVAIKNGWPSSAALEMLRIEFKIASPSDLPKFQYQDAIRFVSQPHRLYFLLSKPN